MAELEAKPRRGRPPLSTGSGDRGFTYDPVTRGWVPKWHPCIELAGALDEAEASLALARTACKASGLSWAAEILEKLENLLFRLGFTVAGRNCISSRDLDWVEEVEAELSRKTLKALDSFRLNGATFEAAAVALARTAVRRAERAYWLCIRLKPGVYSDDILVGQLLNRLSDLLYLLQLSIDYSRGITPPRVSCEGDG